ncbi:hypothetical protein YC2023_122305 [Brassica napus]
MGEIIKELTKPGELGAMYESLTSLRYIVLRACFIFFLKIRKAISYIFIFLKSLSNPSPTIFPHARSENDCGCINIDEGVPVIGMEYKLSQVLQFSWSSLKKSEIAKIPLGEGSMRHGQVLEVNGEKAIGQVEESQRLT